MKNFKTVLGFELKEYFKNKGFIIFTIILALLAFVGLNIPRFIDLGLNKSAEESSIPYDVEDGKVIILDQGGYLNTEILKAVFPNLTMASSEDEVRSAVQNKEADKGFAITGPLTYKSYVYNTEMFAGSDTVISQIMSAQNLENYAKDKNIDYIELSENIRPVVTNEQIVLGKDTTQNYWYCYALIIIIFMMIMIYGQMIATSVASEKSNRSIEVLVTTTSPNSLLFGKVIAGAIASIFQMGLILGTALITYSANRELWGGLLDMFLNIPGEVVATFAVFGIFGYLFYAFIYGAVGALVSKTEDISKTSGGVMMMVMIIYILSLIQLSNVDGAVMKVLSFLPVSSYSAMFSRVALGTVSIVEVIISFVILVASVFGAGVVAAKIYRMGTLRYGNPIKLSTAIRDIRKKNN